MNVRCPSCETVYRVDPAKVPDEGVRASCATCGTVFPVTHQRETPTPVESHEPVVDVSAVTVDEADSAVPDIAPASQTTPPAFELEAADEAEEELGTAPAAPMSLVDSTSDTPTSGADLDFDPVPFEAPEIDEPVIPRSAPPPTLQPPPPRQQQEPPAMRVARPPARPKISKPFIHPGAGSPRREAPRAPARPTAPVFKPTPGMPIQRPPVPEITEPGAAVEAPAPRPEAKASVSPVAPTADRKPVNPFLSKDPAQKARRLARALVSDMIVYQPKKRQDALAAGNLKDAFDEEIKKSWEEYVQQVGEDLADSTDYFKEALNEILAGGRSIF